MGGPLRHDRDRARPAVLLAVLCLATTALAGCATSTPRLPHATAPSAVSTTTSTTTGTLPVRGAAVDRLVVSEPGDDLPTYHRDAFGDGWDYDPATGCNTRERVLIAESAVPATIEARCHPTAGRWTSLYDAVTTTDPSRLEIDHLVPLADAWRSGAAGWSAARRESYANDLADPAVLIAVTSHTNRSKSDRTPDRWLPPDRGAWCTYAAAWVEVKVRYRLTVTGAEKATLVRLLEGC